MAENELAVERQIAGADYLKALRSLGLDPECLFWADDTVVGQEVLVLVTSLFDYVGPLGISEILFRAYDKAITPKNVDPFIVRIHSPKHKQIKEFGEKFGRRIKSPLFAFVSKIPEGVKIKGISMSNDVTIYSDWIYVFDLDLRAQDKNVDLARRWKRFQRNVDAKAA